MLKCNSTRNAQSCFRTMSSPFLLVEYTDLWVINKIATGGQNNKEGMYTWFTSHYKYLLKYYHLFLNMA